jgi:zinc transporter ZupT
MLLLVVDALAPVAGALLAQVLRIDPSVLAFQLAFFAGFLLYLGASDLLPHVHERPRFALIFSTIAGPHGGGGGVRDRARARVPQFIPSLHERRVG